MTVTAATRELSITYGGFTVSGPPREIYGYSGMEVSRDRAWIAFDVIITQGTEAEFAAECVAIEKAFSKPYQDLRVVQGDSTLAACSQSGNTGLDAIATISKPGGRPDSGRSRRYRIRIEWGLPALFAATKGLRDSSVTLTHTPAGRATVTLRGVFTAVGKRDALAVHDAAIVAWSAAQLSFLGISSYELERAADVEVSVNRKTARFERVFRELIFSEGGSASDTAIVAQSLVVTRQRRGSEYSPKTQGASDPTDSQAPSAVKAAPLMEVSARFDCWIDKEVTQDIAGKWDAIKSWVVEQIRSIAGANGFGLMSMAPAYDMTENRITAIVAGVCPDPEGGAIIQNLITTERQTVPGWEIVPIWDGDPESALVFRGTQVRTETRSERVRTLSGAGGGGASTQSFVLGAGPAAAGAAPAAAAPQAGGQRWLVLSKTEGERPLAVGTAPDVIEFTETWKVTVSRPVNAR